MGKKLITLLIAGTVAGLIGAEPVEANLRKDRAAMSEPFYCNCSSLVKTDLTIVSDKIREPCKVMVFGDTHYTIDDERGEPYRKYSARMSKYGPKDMKVVTDYLKTIQEQKIDAVLFIGDVFSFPSEAGVEQFLALMKKSCSVPWYYTAGNHDWCYEGMPGDEVTLREEWIRKRLLPLYQGYDPMCYAVKIHGVKFILIDNSIGWILPEQLEFLKEELADGMPSVLCVHIPLYLPTHGHGDDYCCGDPDWHKNDTVQPVSRWKGTTAQKTTMEFHKVALHAPNLLGIAAGHTHNFATDQIGDKFQIVTPWGWPVTLNFQKAQIKQEL